MGNAIYRLYTKTSTTHICKSQFMMNNKEKPRVECALCHKYEIRTKKRSYMYYVPELSFTLFLCSLKRNRT